MQLTATHKLAVAATAATAALAAAGYLWLSRSRAPEAQGQAVAEVQEVAAVQLQHGGEPQAVATDDARPIRYCPRS